jgi:hypothetical protein
MCRMKFSTHKSIVNLKFRIGKFARLQGAEKNLVKTVLSCTVQGLQTSQLLLVDSWIQDGFLAQF